MLALKLWSTGEAVPALWAGGWGVQHHKGSAGSDAEVTMFKGNPIGFKKNTSQDAKTKVGQTALNLVGCMLLAVSTHNGIRWAAHCWVCLKGWLCLWQHYYNGIRWAAHCWVCLKGCMLLAVFMATIRWAAHCWVYLKGCMLLAVSLWQHYYNGIRWATCCQLCLVVWIVCVHVCGRELVDDTYPDTLLPK